MIHLVTRDFPPVVGGVAAWVEDLGRALVEAGEPVTVYAKEEGDTRAADRALPFPVIRMQGRSWARWGARWVRLQVGPRLRAGDAVVVSTWPLALGLGGRAPTVVGLHGSEITELDTAPTALRDLKARFVAPSRFLVAEAARLGLRAEKIPWPLQPAAAVAPGEALCLIARLEPRKGVGRAMALARACGRPLRVVGGGPASAELRGEGVQWLGPLPRGAAVEALAGCAANLLLSRPHPDGRGAEGFGLSLLEGRVRGVPAVGSRAGGIPEAVGEGLLLDEGESAEQAAGRLEAWLATPGLRERTYDRVRAEHNPTAAARALMDLLR